MTPKQKWLAQRLILPAGILPPAVTYADLKTNAQSVQKTGVAGIEYDLLMDQDVQKIKTSAIGNKILAVHAPFPFFGHASFKNNMALINLATIILYGKNWIKNENFRETVDKTCAFAKNLGAKITVFHTYHLDHHDLGGSLAYLAEAEKKFGVTVTMEHEAAYAYDWETHPWKYFKKIDGSIDWTTNPLKMLAVLDKERPQKKFALCLDTCSLISLKMPLLSTLKKVYPRLGHLHMANSLPGFDLATEINSPEDTEIVRWLYDQKYSGLITAEINMTEGKKEELIGQIYGASSILRFPVFKQQAVKNAQAHLENSCRYLLNNI